MITLTEQEKMTYKRNEIDSAVWNGKKYLYIKGYETDGNNEYVIIDIDSESDSMDTIIIRRMYHTKYDSYFTYKGSYFYNWDLSRVL